MRLILLFLLTTVCCTGAFAQDIFLIGNIDGDSSIQLVNLVNKISAKTGAKKVMLMHTSLLRKNGKPYEINLKENDWKASLRTEVKSLSRRLYSPPTRDSVEVAVALIEKKYKGKKTVRVFDKSIHRTDGEFYFDDWTNFLSKVSKDAKWVYLLNVNSQTPTLQITTTKRRTYGAELMLTGTAACNVGKIDSVVVKLNNGNWVPVDATPENWNMPLNLVPGDNAIQVKAVGNLRTTATASINVFYEKLTSLPIQSVFPLKNNNLDQCNHGGNVFSFQFTSDVDLLKLIKDEQLELKFEDSLFHPFRIITVGNYTYSDFVLSPDNKYCVYISVSTLFPAMDNEGNAIGGCISPTETFYYYYRLRDKSFSTEKVPFHFSSSMVPGKDKECICRMPVKDK